MIEFLLILCSTLFLLLMQAFFSGSEMAMVSIEKNHLRHQAALGSRGARYALSMLDRPDWMLSTTLVGTNIATVANTTIVTAYAIKIFGESGGFLAPLILIPLIWLFAEIIPKSVFQQKSRQIVPIVIYGLWFFSFLLSPIIYVFSLVSRLINRGNNHPASPFIQREELISMVRMPDVVKGDIKEIEKDMIQRVFNFSETTAEQAMTPLDKVEAIAHNSTVREALQLSRSVNHIRFPVYVKDKSNVTGLLNTLEILGEPGANSIQNYIHPIYTTKAKTSIAHLLTDLRAQKALVGIVVRKKKAIGLISLEDIMEEVVADIEDEYDETNTPKLIQQLGARNYLVSARISPAQLNDKLPIGLKNSKAASLAGLLLEHFNEIPPEGASVEINKICYTINKASPQAILDVQITW